MWLHDQFDQVLPTCASSLRTVSMLNWLHAFSTCLDEKALAPRGRTSTSVSSTTVSCWRQQPFVQVGYRCMCVCLCVCAWQGFLRKARGTQLECFNQPCHINMTPRTVCVCVYYRVGQLSWQHPVLCGQQIPVSTCTVHALGLNKSIAGPRILCLHRCPSQCTVPCFFFFQPQ